MKLTLALAASLTLAGLAPASAQIIVDHQPYKYGGTTSDLAFGDNFNRPEWQHAADDFQVAVSAEVLAINWWAWYSQDNPPVYESFQLRLYSNRDTQNLPGKIEYEQVLSDPNRVATGRHISVSGLPREFRFHSTLPLPMPVDAGKLYWIEITQLDDIDSWYFAEFSQADRTGHVFLNAYSGGWGSSPGADLAFQLIVPEPATAAILAVGMAALVAARRRRTPVPGPPGRHRASAVDQP